jgi:hypothetical protein
MLGNPLEALVALFGLVGVGAVVCAIVWSLFASGGRSYDWLLSFVAPLGLASISTFIGWLFGWL